jgi:uncharacterized protein (DUF4415 family)
MTEKKRVLKDFEWDPDTPPELDDEWFARADHYRGGELVRRGRPKLAQPKVSTTLRLDADVIAQFKAKGPKWQTRINDALRDWLKQAG